MGVKSSRSSRTFTSVAEVEEVDSGAVFLWRSKEAKCFCAQITAALELEEQARKQRLSYKVEQLILAMSFES